MLLISVALSLFLWVIILLLPWRPWSTRERFDDCDSEATCASSEITVLIPARNEADFIETSLISVLSQSEDIMVIVVDDCSEDGTGSVAKRIMGNRGRVIRGTMPPRGWTGKLWALEKGLAEVCTPYVLLMDADIVLEKDVVTAALSFMKRHELSLFSLMARLRMESIVELLFMPAFVYFFKLIYPFSIVNGKNRFVAAAAGGFILAKTDVLREIDAFSSIKGCIIDDCTLAMKIKRHGGSIFLAITKCVRSIREYKRLGEVWAMVERTAYTELHYSPFLLVLTTVLIILSFLVPLAGLFSACFLTFVMSALALSIMLISYVPVLRYYAVSIYLCFTLPLVALLYMGMTWSSAINYYLGNGASWKGRRYREK